MNKLHNGWTEYKLKDLCVINYGKGLGKSNIVNGNIPVYSSGGIIGFHNTYNVNSEGVIIGRKGNAGSVFYSDKPFFCIDTAFYIEPNNQYDLKYLFYKLVSMNLKNHKTGTAIPGLIRNDIYKLSISIPPLDEQKRIASALSKIDAYLENTIKLIEEKERFKRGIAKKLLTCKEGENIPEARFKGFEGEWETKTLENICKNIKTGKLNANAMEKDGQYRFYTCAKDYYKINTYAFDGEAILISGNGAHVGYVHYYNGKFNAYQRTYVLMDFTENILFIKYYLDIHLKYKINIENNKGNIPYIVLNTIKDMEIKFPSLEEQEKICGYLSLLDKEIDNLKKQKELIKEMKKGAMQKLLSGEVRLVYNYG